MDVNKMIRGIKKNNPACWTFFVDAYGPYMKGVIHKTLQHHPDLKDDALNDAFLAIWQHVQRFDPSRADFKTWCANVAKYKAIDLLRRELKHRNRSYDDDIGSDVFLYDEGDDEIEALLSELLSPLNKDDQALFRRLFYNGESYDEVALAMGKSKSNLYNRVSRGRKKLFQKKKEEKI